MDLHVADRIQVEFNCDDELRTAIEAHKAYVAGETLATAFEFGELDDSGFQVTLDHRRLNFRIEVTEAAS
jgi:hypothetical protein